MAWRNIQGALSGLGGGAGGKSVIKTLQGADMAMTGTITTVSGAASIVGGFNHVSHTLTSGAWQRVGEYAVRAQTQQRWGYGREGVDQANIGILYFLPKTQVAGSAAGGATLPCMVRIAVVDSEDRIRPDGYVVHAVRSERLANDLTSSYGKLAVFFLPEKGAMGRVDDKLVIEVNADAAYNGLVWSGTASTLRVDTSLYM